MANLLGTADDDELTGTPTGDTIYGYAGNDTLRGEAGNDNLFGGAGNNSLFGGAGADYLFIGNESGSNTLFGDAGNDFLTGGSGADTLEGGDGDDRLYAGAGDDLLYGGAGADILDGGPGNDWLEGGPGDDTLYSGGGVDALFGGVGDDRFVVSDTVVRLEDSGGEDAIDVYADWLKVPSSIETRRYLNGSKALPYWLDAALADGIAGLPSWLGSTASYYYTFPKSAPSYLTNRLDESAASLLYGWQPFNEQQQLFTRQALNAISQVVDVNFIAATDSDRLNTLSFSTNYQGASRGVFTSPAASFAASDVIINSLASGLSAKPDPDVAAPTADGFEAALWLRSIGGALGLKTPALETEQAGIDSPAAPFLSLEVDIAPANAQQASGQILSSMLAGVKDIADTQYSLNLGLLDLAALHFLYGPSPSARAGDDVYTLDPARTNFIWDGGGIDTLDASASNQGVTLYLSPGEHGFAGAAAAASIFSAGQQTINFGTRIEKVVGSDFADTLVGDGYDNTLTGGDGSDLLDGGGGIDTVLIEGYRHDTTLTRLEDSDRDFDWSLSHGAYQDKLESIERIEFNDQGLALDLEGNAGAAAKLLGVLIGPSGLRDPQLVAAVLAYADAGRDLESLLNLGLEILLGPKPSSAEVINLLHRSLTGADASAALVTSYAAQIDRGELTPTGLAKLAAETELNLVNIDFVGLVETGLSYHLSI
jgi:serralysin